MIIDDISNMLYEIADKDNQNYDAVEDMIDNLYMDIELADLNDSKQRKLAIDHLRKQKATVRACYEKVK